MEDYLAVKIGISEAAHRDPVGLRGRSPSEKMPLPIPYRDKGRSTKDAKLPRTVGFGTPNF